MKEKLNYSIVEVRDFCGDVVAYDININYKGVAIVSKEAGVEAISAIKKNGKFYNYDVRTTHTGELCWTFYFEIGNKLPEEEEKNVAVYGHCPYCGSKTFVAVPRVPGSVFHDDYYGEPDLMCKNCRKIVDGNDMIDGRYSE